ncbi:MAG: hypothetical protein M1818_002570 [Claussenomyces sp. TS43310]|nr:MAG: hypothetical protein M1818_002570 [Claussenomyces sp. TS43310]
MRVSLSLLLWTSLALRTTAQVNYGGGGASGPGSLNAPQQFLGEAGGSGPCVGTKNSLDFEGSQYLGCFDFSGDAPPAAISPSPTGAYYPFLVANGGVSTTYTATAQYPAWTMGSSAFYSNSLTPRNCTLACRAHGYSYAALVGDASCQCGTFAPTVQTSPFSTNPSDNGTSNYCHGGSPCLGDSTQYCGYPGGNVADVYVDNSFPKWGTWSNTAQAGNYKYIGCFAQSSQMVYKDSGATNGFSIMAQCFEFCASLGFPLAAFEYDNNTPFLLSDCACGTELQQPVGYQIPDNQCNIQCSYTTVGTVTTTKSGTATTSVTTATSTAAQACTTTSGGPGCCAYNAYAVYANPFFMGCFQPPLPSMISSGSTVPYSSPAAIRSTVVGNTVSTASYPGAFVTSTNPPSPPQTATRTGSNIGATWLGCLARSQNSVPPITSTATQGGVAVSTTSASTMNVERCYAYCAGLAGNVTYFALNGGVNCACGNALATPTTLKLYENCQMLCGGNSAPLTYEYCGAPTTAAIFMDDVYSVGVTVTLPPSTTSTLATLSTLSTTSTTSTASNFSSTPTSTVSIDSRSTSTNSPSSSNIQPNLSTNLFDYDFADDRIPDFKLSIHRPIEYQLLYKVGSHDHKYFKCNFFGDLYGNIDYD